MPDVIPLSAIDHLVTARPFLLQLSIAFPSKLDAQRLIEAFHTTAQRFVGATATLTRIDERTFGFDLSRDASEIRATTDGPDIPLHSCVDLVTCKMDEPLTRARIVDRGSRGTAIGFSMSHAVTDGYGFFLFLAAWAAQTRGAPFPAPNCDRTLLSNPEARHPAEPSPAVGHLEQSGFFLIADAEPPARHRFQDWLIPQSRLRSEKEREPGNYTTNDLLTAFTWKECLQNETTPSTTLACPVDIRKHRPSLGPLYFGNAFLLASVTVSSEQLRAASAPQIAGWIHAAVKAVPPRIDAAIAELEALWSSRGLAILPRLYDSPPDSGFLISNLSRISLEMLDFGAGPPVDVDYVPATSYARCCFVLAAGDNLRLISTHGPASVARR